MSDGVKPWLVRFRAPGGPWIRYRRCATEYEACKSAETLAGRMGGYGRHYQFDWGIE